VTREWIDHIQKNEREFGSAVRDLQHYELDLVRSLNHIEKVQASTTTIKKAYSENMQELDDVTMQQSSLLKELETMDSELQNYIDRQVP